VTPVLENVRSNFIMQVVDLYAELNPYVSLSEAEEMLGQGSGENPIRLIHDAYQTYFIDSPDSDFDKTLFHFLLRRLGAQRDRFAVDHCKGLIEKHPEETDPILEYLAASLAVAEVEPDLIGFLNSADAVYPYQNYQIFAWIADCGHRPSTGLLEIIRRFAFDRGQPPYVRSVCRKLLGEYGSPADLERLEADYADARNALEQSEIICSLRHMETGRRNAFFRRAEGDGFLNRNAVRLVRSIDS
jgi:hypothetical protein